MPDDARFVGSSIEELLVALAEGVREAQIALNAGPLTDSNGRPLAVYQLPYLDFVVNVEIATLVGNRGRPVALLFMPVPGTGGSESQRQIRSTITGRLVATPPGDGLPVPRIRLAAVAPRSGRARIDIEVSNTAGERLAGQMVEINIDDETSRRLSAANGLAGFARPAQTRLEQALVLTDAQGRASVGLAVDPATPRQGIVAVTATVGTARASAAVPLAESP